MRLRTLVRPRSTADELPASLISRVLIANGYQATTTCREAIAHAVIHDAQNGYTKTISNQRKLAQFFFPGQVSQNDPFWIGGRICIRCILENKPLSITASHHDLGVCVLHNQKTCAFCPRCYAPASSNWLFEKRCANCHLHIYKFRRSKCSIEELETAAQIWRWLRGATYLERNVVLPGLWTQPWYLRPWLLRSLMKLITPIKENASCVELSWRCDESRRWLLQHARDWQVAAMSRFAERCPAPAEDASFAQYVAWLNCGLGGKSRRSAWPYEVSNGAYALLPQLVCHGLLPVIKGKSPLHRTKHCNHLKTPKEKTEYMPTIHDGKFCQMKLPITIDIEKQNSKANNLSELNCKPFTKMRVKQNRFEKKWRYGNPQYLFSSAKKTPLDVFDASIQTTVPKCVNARKNLLPLYVTLNRVSTKRRTVIESELALGRLPFYQIEHTGNYWRDLAIDVEELGACERNAKGGDHVGNQLF